MDEKRTSGVLFAFSAYLLWGFTPLYWKLFSGVNSVVLLAHRVFWAFFVSIVMLVVSGGFSRFKSVLRDRKALGWIILRTVLLTLNWYTYIWAVGRGMVLEASLGYYLNPLVSILLGLVFLKERLNSLQWAAVGFAVAGVALKTILVGKFPLVSVVLALSFGFYGLMKKKGSEGSIVGMTIESMLLLPFSSAFLIFAGISGMDGFVTAGGGMKLLYITTGLITVIPLVLFAKGTSRIPLSWIGFLQFVAPTLMLIFGVVAYGEELSLYELAGFSSVWVGVILFVVSSRVEAGKKLKTK